MIAFPVQCQSCKHSRPDSGPGNVCAAFPDGIPTKIIASRHDHRKPYPGDHGIRYEPLDMNAPQFCQHFDRKAADLPWIMNLTQRTTKMLRLLCDIGADNGFFVNTKRRADERGGYGNKEKMSFDMQFGVKVQDKTGVHRASNWYIPRVIIEHENQTNIKKIIEDFRKACLLAVPLRVIIGYGRTDQQARNRSSDLRKFYSDYGLRQIEKGETLLMVGWPQHTGHTVRLQWDRWLLVGERDDWEQV
jgi:hypothetical protein